MANPSILIVDDDQDQLDILRDWLEDSFAVTAHTDPQQALAALNQQKFDLLVTDFEMPGINGATLASRATKTPQNRHIPIIMLTGMNDDLTISVMKSIPRLVYTAKPVNLDEFRKLVDQQLAAA